MFKYKIYPWNHQERTASIRINSTSHYKMIRDLHSEHTHFIYVDYIYNSFWRIFIGIHEVRVIYQSIYKDENKFNTADEAKDRVDIFLAKLEKLKCFI